MALLNCEDVAVEYGDRVVFSGLELAAGARRPDRMVGSQRGGEVEPAGPAGGRAAAPTGKGSERQGRLLVAYLPQESPEPVAETVLGEAMASRTDLARLADEMVHLELGWPSRVRERGSADEVRRVPGRLRGLGRLRAGGPGPERFWAAWY